MHNHKIYEMVKKSKLVNEKWYKNNYSDVAISGMDPIKHYIKYGAALGRKPSIRFDVEFYISQVPEIQGTNDNPLVHYLLKGKYNKSLRINPDLPTEEESKLKNKAVAHLWGGHSRSALKELENVYLSDRYDSKTRAFAAWHTARWYYFVGNYSHALGIANLVRNLDYELSKQKRFVMLHASCFQNLGQRSESEVELNAYLVKKPRDSDALLMLSNVFDDQKKLEHINKIYIVNGLQPIVKADPALELSLDNIKSSEKLKNVSVQEKKISVVMPIYNAKDNIDTAIRGLLNQTWRNIEILAVDDCSTDGTYDKLLEWSKIDSRVKVILQSKNSGAYAARNTGLSYATGDYITTHDSDDWSHSQKIETQVSYFSKNPKLKGVISYWVRARKNLEFTQNWRLNSELIHWSHSSFLFKREVVDKLGGWDVVNVGGDTEFIWRVESAFGSSSIKKISKNIPFSFALEDESSLTRTKSTHVKTIHYGLRHIYRASCKWWHLNQKIKFSVSSSTRAFPAPRSMYERHEKELFFDRVIAGDFSSVEQAKAAWQICKNTKDSIALFHWPNFEVEVSELNDFYFNALRLSNVEPVVVGQVVRSFKYFILDESLLRYNLDSYPTFRGFTHWELF